eukprot:TRINITY_DN14175_c0_g1_i1.p1 TRINITY_DN14175_c0_g1~~TRINITY_DN14175_c0_g1_i1.p1  ORF type:complete len:1177 (+),score=281.47 TRINITY_DN14175_c0_g1_i1:134-3664(+)
MCIRDSPNPILSDISINVRAGQLVALMGPSGAGKTTLLNTMAGRVYGGATISGELEINGVLRPANQLTPASGYVLQQLRLAPWLTAEETLTWAAAVGTVGTTVERDALVKDTLLKLGLNRCDARVADLSGGEKRRVAVGVQLVSQPKLLFLDEPTTGLDSFSSLRIIELLKTLSQSGCTVVCSIHQPRADIFSQFELLCLLSAGKTVVVGAVPSVITHLSELGFDCPENINPADFVIDLVTIDYRTQAAEDSSQDRLALLTDASCSLEKTPESTPAAQALSTPDPPSAIQQLAALLLRGWLRLSRDVPLVLGALVEATVVGAFVGALFFQLGDSEGDVSISRRSLLYLVGSMQPYVVILFTVFRLTEVDMPVFDAEMDDSSYRMWVGVLAMRLTYLPLDIAQSSLFGAWVYLLSGLRLSWGHFGTFLLCCFMGHMIATSIAAMAVSFSRKFDIASLIANSQYTFIGLAGGFLLQADSIPVWLKWMKVLSFQWYEFQIFAANELRDHHFDRVGTHVIEGNTYLVAWFGHLPDIPQLFLILALITVIYQLIAAVMLQLNRVHAVPTLAGAVSGNESNTLSRRPSQQAGYFEVPVSGEHKPGANPDRIGLRLRNITMTVGKPSSTSQNADVLLPEGLKDLSGGKTILHNVNADFPAGCFSVTMGPSGSGKTSTLAVVAGRARPPLSVRGTVTFDNSPLRSGDCAFVMQDDDLLVGLTARETLLFAAKLCQCDEDQVDKLLFELCLPHCAHTLVANCSGGEKRRLSVACQMVKSPLILVLDEPTSGLDAATARYLVESLCTLARLRGATIVASIHQPRSDILSLVTGTVALIARGHCMYSGTMEGAIEYFGTLGYAFPPRTNPGDFFLDVLSEEQILDHYSSPTRSQDEHTAESPVVITSQSSPSAFYVIRLLIWRSLLNYKRQPKLISSRVMQPMAFTIILVMFYRKSVLNDVFNRVGLLYEWNPFVFVGMLTCIANFPAERNVYLRERHEQAYSSTSFLASYMFVELPCSMLSAVLSSLLLNFVVGLSSSGSVFIESAVLIFLVITNGESAGLIFCSAIKHAGFAVSLVSISLGLVNILCGWFTAAGQLAEPLKSLNYISPLKYAAEFSGIIQFAGKDLSMMLANGAVVETPGELVIQSYGFNVDHKWSSFGCLVACTVFYRVIAFLTLRYVPQWRNW